MADNDWKYRINRKGSIPEELLKRSRTGRTGSSHRRYRAEAYDGDETAREGNTGTQGQGRW